MRTNGVNVAYVDVKQRTVHKGVVKHARSFTLARASGYWHTNKVKVRPLDNYLKVLYAAYRPLRGLNSEAEADEIPPSKDANLEVAPQI